MIFRDIESINKNFNNTKTKLDWIMAIKVIAQRREVKLGKKPGMKFVMRTDLYIPIAEKKVFTEAATHSGISSGVIKAAWDAAGEVIRMGV